jgi:hypothetical protein
MNRFLYLQTLALCGSLAISACSSVNKDWANASAQNTIAAYQSFLNKHSGDAHSRPRTSTPPTATNNIFKPSRMAPMRERHVTR